MKSSEIVSKSRGIANDFKQLSQFACPFDSKICGKKSTIITDKIGKVTKIEPPKGVKT